MPITRLHNLDFIKFLCCVTILICHSRLCRLSLPGMPRTDIGVEFFFILAGFFLYFSFKKQESTADFVVKRWVRLMPVVLASFLAVILLHCSGLIVQQTHFKDVFTTLFFVRHIGLFNETQQIRYLYDNSYLWFIGPLFWCSLFYFVIFKSSVPLRLKCFTTALLVYVSYFYYVHDFYRPILKLIPANSGLFRGIAGIGFGILCAALAEYFAQHQAWHKKARFSKGIFTLLEIAFFGMMIDLLFIHVVPVNFRFYAFIVFFILTILFYLQKGYFSRFLNRPFLGRLGVWSYSIYVFQYIPQIIVTKGNLVGGMPCYLEWKAQHPILVFIVIGIILPVITGGGVYYLIERPIYKYLITSWKKMPASAPPSNLKNT